MGPGRPSKWKLIIAESLEFQSAFPCPEPTPPTWIQAPPAAPGETVQKRWKKGLSALQHAAQEFHVLGESGVVLAQFLDLSHRVHDRGVVASAELAPDLGQRPGG